MHTYIGEQQFKCEGCAAAFSENGIPKMHMHTHTGEREFKGEECSAVFSQTVRLRLACAPTLVNDLLNVKSVVMHSLKLVI